MRLRHRTYIWSRTHMSTRTRTHMKLRPKEHTRDPESRQTSVPKPEHTWISKPQDTHESQNSRTNMNPRTRTHMSFKTPRHISDNILGHPPQRTESNPRHTWVPRPQDTHELHNPYSLVGIFRHVSFAHPHVVVVTISTGEALPAGSALMKSACFPFTMVAGVTR